jgi:hypothetical protein
MQEVLTIRSFLHQEKVVLEKSEVVSTVGFWFEVGGSSPSQVVKIYLGVKVLYSGIAIQVCIYFWMTF